MCIRDSSGIQRQPTYTGLSLGRWQAMMTTIWRYDRSGIAIQCEDEVTEERALTIYVNGTLAVRLASSGEFVDAAAVGHAVSEGCLLYTSDAADDLLCVDLG